MIIFWQGDDPFWNKKPSQDKPAKPQDKPVKPVRPKTKVIKKPAKRRTTASSDPPVDDDAGNPEPEVELDSLGSFFIHLIDNDYYQYDAEGSHADDVEVIILSRFRSSANIKNPSSKPESKIFSPSCLLGPKLSFEDAAAWGSPYNPAQRPGSYLRRFTEQSGSETPIRGLLSHWYFMPKSRLFSPAS